MDNIGNIGVQTSTPSNAPYTICENREWLPVCDEEELKPKIGMIFQTFDECQEFYKKYAQFVGFGVRSSSVRKNKAGTKYWKYFVCSKQGFKRPVKSTPQSEAIMQAVLKVQKGKRVSNVAKKRRVAETREGCNAHIRLTSCDGGYMITAFHEPHVHPLVTPSRTHFITSAREVSSMHKHMVYNSYRTNVGPSKVYDISKELMDGHQNVGCTKKDIQNYQRDLKVLIKDSDAHMFIDMLSKKKEIEPGFYFSYEIDEENRPKQVFWSDSISRMNYSIFGDVLSFDTTHGTNKYSMVFAPFTGINNHRQLICYGAVLLGDEKRDSFVWLFENFLDAMGGKQPNTIITNQDPTMKLAIGDVLDMSIHRYCMWHIMRKVPEKVGPHVNYSEDFHERLKLCVWSSKTPEAFESTWEGIISDFGLSNNEWFCQIYEIREDWVHV